MFIDIILKLFLGDEALLAKLYSFIDTDQPLNPLLASFFSKTIGVLVARKVDQVIRKISFIQNCNIYVFKVRYIKLIIFNISFEIYD